jgi:outer membrane protein OmpA-like peptidoglycan-associated protein
VAISVYQYSADTVSTLVDVIEVEQVETGLVAVDLEALRQGIEEEGRVILDGIFFDFDKATLKPESKEALDNIASYLEEHADKQFYVVGHTDSKGSFTYNRDLSKSRAQVVVEALATEYGIGAERLEGHGVGPLVPVFANTSEAGRERNRRVELVER